MRKQEPLAISRTPPEPVSLRYDRLRELGLAAVQRYSGGIWTDYNHHDPGVTILEQLCYALTDLGYRTHFDIHQLLFHATDRYDLARQNVFYPPSQIFPSQPLTELDYRRLVIDRIKRVRNAWVIPVMDDPSGHKGLFDIQVQCGLELDEAEREEVALEVTHLYHAHRQLGQDLRRVILLEEDRISLAGKIHIAADAIGEVVLAAIYSAVDQDINPEVSYHDPLTLVEEGSPPEEVFEGPLPSYGYIAPDALLPKVSTLYVSRIRDIISKVPGVQEIEELTVLKNGIRVSGDIIEIAEGRYPVVWNNLDQYDTLPDKVTFYKEQVFYAIDPMGARQLYDARLAADQISYLRKIRYEEGMTPGDFQEDDIRAYYSIQKELPDVYGLQAHSLSAHADKSRLAQRRQLKAYLLFFEQWMANYLAQLAQIRRFFSIDASVQQTYFTQLPVDIPDLKEIVPEGDLEAYEEAVRQIVEGEGTFLERRNRVLDHLLARFSERYPADLLRKFYTSDHRDAADVDKDMMQAKMDMLAQYPRLSRDRGRAFNYRQPSWESVNVPGLLQRVGHLLHLRDLRSRSLVQPILEAATIERIPDESDWVLREIAGDDGQSYAVRMLPVQAYQADKVIYYSYHRDFVEDLFLFGTSERYYKIVREVGPDAPAYLLYFSQMTQQAVVIATGEEVEELRSRMRLAIERFRKLDQACEGFHLVEHILLRPLETKVYLFSLSDREGETYLVGQSGGDIQSQRDTAEDVLLLGTDAQHYDIVTRDGDNLLEVVLYDTEHVPIARMVKAFHSRAGAEAEIQRSVAYLLAIQSGEVGFDDVHEIKLESGQLQEFPADFSYAHTCSLLVPNWPSRMQNQEFRKLLAQTLEEHLPAHLALRIYFVPVEKMIAFEQLYTRWLEEKVAPQEDYHALDILSLQLVQMLQRFEQSDGSV